MTALAKIVEPTTAFVEEPSEVLIHVRFWPSAEIFTIDGRPEAMTDRDWFNLLYMGVPEHYQTLANGRGFFRIPRPTFDQLTADIAA